MRKWLTLTVVAALVLLLDQISKALVASNMTLYEQWMPVEALRPYFTLTYVQNTGAAFGIFPNGGLLFTLVAFVVVGMVVYMYRSIPDEHRLVQVALGLMLGGALGNLVDRLRLGYVVDFFDFKFWPVFNVADSGIVVGVLALLVLTWLDDRQQARQAAADADTDASVPPLSSE